MSIDELCRACRTGNNQTVARILARGEVDVNSKYNGMTPLMHAMTNNKRSIVTTLLSYPHTKLDCTGMMGFTGLHRACHCNSHSVIGILSQDSRCTPAILNIKDRVGRTPLMAAVEHGHLDCVKELDRLEGTDFGTKNRQGETLIELARKKKYAMIVQYLTERSARVAADVATNTQERINHVAEDVASNALEMMNLRDIAEELDNLDEIEAVIASEKDVLQERHVKENAKIVEEQEAEIEILRGRHDEENESTREKQRQELAELERIVLENRQKRSNLERRLQSRLSPAGAAAAGRFPEAPECPVCLEDMKPPMQIYNCRNGHLICGDCMPKVASCTNCRTEYTGRATAVEQMLRQMFGHQ